MSKIYISGLRDGDSFADVFLAAEKQLRVNKNGNPYVQMELRDRSGGLSARMWNAGDLVFRSFENGDFLRAEGKVQNFQGTLQIVLEHFEKTEAHEVELADFMPHTEYDIGKLQDKLRKYLRGAANPHLKALGELFLMDDDILRGVSACPAGIKMHHAYVGGLLEHTVTMMDVADAMIGFYPGVDRDLVIMGLFLHDLGKIRELTFTRGFNYSDEGQLVGHLIQGIEMLNEKVNEVYGMMGEPFPRELHVRLKHIILSHHGTLEHGSPKVPMTPEAIFIHQLDNFDSRMHMVLRELKDDRMNQTAWTPWSPANGRKIYKGGAFGDLNTPDESEQY